MTRFPAREREEREERNSRSIKRPAVASLAACRVQFYMPFVSTSRQFSRRWRGTSERAKKDAERERERERESDKDGERNRRVHFGHERSLLGNKDETEASSRLGKGLESNEGDKTRAIPRPWCSFIIALPGCLSTWRYSFRHLSLPPSRDQSRTRTFVSRCIFLPHTFKHLSHALFRIISRRCWHLADRRDHRGNLNRNSCFWEFVELVENCSSRKELHFL